MVAEFHRIPRRALRSVWHPLALTSNVIQDHMAFKNFTLPVMEMEGADESWKNLLHISNSKVGCLIAPPRSGTTVNQAYQPI